ncbi:MAG: hypothetical protein J0L94_11915 [Rhodothermia bacterium]|nr:hypothetical protein [Rhodothermia bacterium]
MRLLDFVTPSRAIRVDVVGVEIKGEGLVSAALSHRYTFRYKKESHRKDLAMLNQLAFINKTLIIAMV